MNVIAVILLWGIFLTPGIPIISGMPSVRLDDFLVFIMLLWAILGGYLVQWPKSSFRVYAFLICIMSCWVMVTIMANNRLTAVGDYFEIYKYIKYLLVAFLFYWLATKQDISQRIQINFVYIFAVLLLFNLMNLFNVASFNSTILPLYATEHHTTVMDALQGSGKAIRMLGTMGNPNNNAILWAGLVAIFLCLQSTHRKFRFVMLLGALVSGVMCLLSQSRTTFAALVVGLLVYGVVAMRQKNFGKILFIGLLFGVGGYAVISLLDLSYLIMLWDVDIDENESWLVRLQVWDYLYGMIQQSPLFGYGPDKEFFYKNELYSENEYILMTWRYGYVGVVFYTLWLVLPWIYAKRLASQTETVWAKAVMILTPLYLITAVTNNPMSEPRLSLLYAVISGLMFAEVEFFYKASQRSLGLDDDLKRSSPHA